MSKQEAQQWIVQLVETGAIINGHVEKVDDDGVVSLAITPLTPVEKIEFEIGFDTASLKALFECSSPT